MNTATKLKIITQYARAAREKALDVGGLGDEAPIGTAATDLADQGIRLLWSYDMSPAEEIESETLCNHFCDIYWGWV